MLARIDVFALKDFPDMGSALHARVPSGVLRAGAVVSACCLPVCDNAGASVLSGVKVPPYGPREPGLPRLGAATRL